MASLQMPGRNPFDSPSEYRSLYNPEEIPLAIMTPPSEPVSPQIRKALAFSRLQNMTESQNRVMRVYYYAKVSHIDHGIGIVLKALEEKGLMDNTWIIYTSDHGDFLHSHCLSGKGPAMYEEITHVPFIVKWPGTAPGGGLDSRLWFWHSCCISSSAALRPLICKAGPNPLRPLHEQGHGLCPT